ncbi:MAG: hypothetical protein LBK03_00780, partial [Bacteroidales bacterium]|nr:hypothetical protein [Bacteroidales bacterium]
MQQALSAIDARYEISSQEIEEKSYGESSKEALLKFQQDFSLTQNTHTILSDTVQELNKQLANIYHICGFITADYGNPVQGVEVRAYQGQTSELGSGVSLADGSYRIYPALGSLLEQSGKLKYPLTVKLECFKNSQEQSILQENLLIKDWESIFNISSDKFAAFGDPLYATLIDALTFNATPVDTLSSKTLTELQKISQDTEIDMETLMRLMFAQEPMLNKSYYDHEVVFGFLYQNYPTNVPDRLFEESFLDMEEDQWNQYKNQIVDMMQKGFLLMLYDQLLNVLTLAVNKNYIAFRDADSITKIAFTIDAYNIYTVQNTYFLEGGVTDLDMIFALLATTIENATLRQQVTRLFIENINDFDTFISKLKTVEFPTPSDEKTLSMYFQLSRITRNYTPMIKILDEEYGNDIKEKSLRFLLSLPQAEQHRLVSRAGYPEDFNNGFEYVAFVWKICEALYTDTAIVQEIKNNSDLSGAYEYIGKIQEYLSTTNPNFNLLTDKLPADVKDAEFVKQFNTIQGIYQVTPTPEAAAILLKNNITSLGNIYFMGKRELELRLKDTLPQKDIDMIFSAASGKLAGNMNTYLYLRDTISRLSPYAIGRPNIEDLKTKFPNLAELFDELDYCECEHDSSVYSAAAYLADLLNFLDGRAVQKKTVKNFLYYYQGDVNAFIRRSDIGKIWLNVPNTNTILPYIDLVCEVLEEAVLRMQRDTQDKQAKKYEREDKECQTTLTTKELLAAPEHILTATIKGNETTAYDILKEQVYPMFAPLNLWQTEIRAYLKLMNIERYQLMQLFQRADNAPLNSSNASIAAEYFGLTSLEQSIVTGIYQTVTIRNTTWHKWETAGASMSIADFLQDSGLSILELIDISNYYYGTTSIIHWEQLILDSLEDCSYTNKDISGNASSFDKAHRFIRLWRKSGWKIWELDLLLRSAVTHYGISQSGSNDNLDADSLFNLMRFKKQQEILKLSVEELLTFYSDINTETIIENGKEKPCLYDRLFLQKVLSNPLNENLLLLKKKNSESENVSLTDSDQGLVMASLSLKEFDFYFLKDKWDEGGLPYNIAYFNFLYRHGLLAKKLKLSTEDLFTLFSLLNENVDIYAPYSLSFVDSVTAVVQKIKDSKLTIAEYEYLISGTYPAGETLSSKASELALSDELLDKYTESLQSALDKSMMSPTESEIVLWPEEDAAGNETERWGATLSYKENFTNYLLATEQYEPGDIEELIRIVEGTSDMQNTEINTFTERIFASVSYFPMKIDLDKVTSPDKDKVLARYKKVRFYVDASLLSAAVINYLSEWFELSVTAVQLYLSYYLLHNELYLEDKSFGDMLLQAFGGTDGCLLLFSLHKAALLINKKRISETDLALLLNITTKKELFDWYNFALSEANGNTNTLYDFLNLDAMLTLQKQYGVTAENNSLFSLLNKRAHSTLSDNEANRIFFDSLCQLTGWETYQITQWSNLFPDGHTVNDFYFSEPYWDIEQCLDMADKAGVDIITLDAWKTRDNDSANAKQVKDAAKAHYDIDTWLEKLPAVQNPVREAKNNALSSFLIASSIRGNIANGDLCWNNQMELYNYFLLDPEMKPIMKTSRIVQATLSMQLFVQRCLLGLENSAIKTNEDAWDEWEWMKKYRVWEANRKIFLYPENWIEPELRDDKTPFFKDMEDELNQGDITNELVETAFENYLQKLNDVANLFVCGIYREFVDGKDGEYREGIYLKTSKVDTTHVIARTRTTPYQYYYRAYDAIGKKWSYWEKVELDIKGDVVVPMIYNRRLHLFWLSPVQKSRNRNNKDTTQGTKAPLNYTELQLGWSILKNGKWTGTNYSSKKLHAQGHHAEDAFSLIMQYIENSNEIEFSVYRYAEGMITEKPVPNSNKKGTVTASILAGKFYFNADVYRGISYLHNYEWANDAGDTLTYKGIIEEMNEAERTEFKYVGNEKVDYKWQKDSDYHKDYVNYTINAILRASRLYSEEKTRSADGLNNFYLDLNNEATEWLPTYPILRTKNRPVSIRMFHRPDGLWWGVFIAHLDSISFYEDSERSFVLAPSDSNNAEAKYKFSPFYHPYTHLFIKELNRLGIQGLLNRPIQLNPRTFSPFNEYNFERDYHPKEGVVSTDYHEDIVDFNLSEAYGPYNWELFFHAPMYIACKLSQNQKFEEAMNWFHYIFNPTDKSTLSSPQKFWITKPFFEKQKEGYEQEEIENILSNIGKHADAVKAWLNNPFMPHLIARTRPVAYQRNVVMKYIDNLIKWGDQLFRQDSMESNNEATLLYILAYEILGKRPTKLPPDKNKIIITDSYEDLCKKNQNGNSFEYLNVLEANYSYAYSANSIINNISNLLYSQPYLSNRVSAYTAFQNSVSSNTRSTEKRAIAGNSAIFGSNAGFSAKVDAGYYSAKALTSVTVQNSSVEVAYPYNANSEPVPRIDADNFCLPFNDDLLKYWDTVEDRLFKLRNSMNIEGIVRELPLFEPPIDPAMLVRAVAAGLSISEALNDMAAPQPYYRFRVIMQKAIEFTNEVKQLGDKLLSALEKKDAETLNILRSTQEINMQQAIKQVRKLQIDEAKENVENINALIATATARREYYESREFMNALENSSYGLGIAAGVIDTIVNIGKGVAAGLKNIPNSYSGGAGFASSPVAITSLPGGESIAGTANMTMDALAIVGHALDRSASLTATQAGYQRRKEEWDFQVQMADMELIQLDRQLTAAEIRLMVAEKELANLEMQIEQSQSVKEYYRDKYTSETLYNWMITQISTIYFQAYKLAYDMAKKAEKCYQHELGIYETTNFIQFGYWDSLKKGLLSGDRLIHDLHALEAAYMNRNKRTLELTKHISLAQMYPDELIKLIAAEEKEITLDLAEFIFDMDYPGHYMRRIKSVSITIPNVAGPYTTVSFMLTLQQAKVRKEARLLEGQELKEQYIETGGLNDPRFVYQTGGNIMQYICTSSAQNDSGMFELNFGDER